MEPDAEQEEKQLTYEEKQRKYEEEQKKKNIEITRAIVKTWERIFRRQKGVDDMCLRYCMFVDKMGMLVEASLTFMNVFSEENDFPEDLRLEIHKLTSEISGEIDGLLEYCRAPSYSPDAAFGAHLVKNSSFYEHAKENDK